MEYNVCRMNGPVDFSCGLNGGCWKDLPTLEINNALPESSSHRPHTIAKLGYDDNNLYLLYEVDDQYVRSMETEYNTNVCLDSCVEFFVQPCGKEYINFEINCSGAILTYYISDWRRDPIKHGIAKYYAFKEEEFKQLSIYHTLSGQIEGITDPVKWSLGLQIPLTLLQKFYPGLELKAGNTWRANFYKCGGMEGYDHWLTWSPIVGELNFHLPQFFGELKFV